MPVGNTAPPETIYAIEGVKLGVTAAGVRYQNRDDVVLIEMAPQATTAAVTTTNAFCAAPVHLLRAHIAETAPRYLIINTGNANAGTGEDGMARAQAVCDGVAAAMGVTSQAVLPYSTGVIGEPLNYQAIIAGLKAAEQNLGADNWLRAAKGICTTDTVPKLDSLKVSTDDGSSYHITGISKGAGMIRPNMATMLGFVATDANIAQPLLQQMLVQITNDSFNRITIDGDTSTNDCCTLIATGAASDTVIASEEHPHYEAIYAGLKAVFIRLAQLIVRDGEGATKFITVNVTGGNDCQECCDVAYAVAHSPLVKTAFFASDPNWGRILAAVGYAGVKDLDTSRIDVALDEVVICERGGLAESYTEAAGQEVMSRPEIRIHIDLARGDYEDTVYTCDLSYDYVKINADYRS
ncbi:bifunctional glutamate N-acetyltransferase/amino-acid acetyltransferase ArgJ [Psychrobacter arenosus]|uniref:bifunctional glutamate N-acetyltransferase/amino-acid acetyltransferase ArgJ n=1 Tax=Psychrobacter arenosus TaxID=256326 RepID=UPI001919A24A|nr:bifunctional glutamate N-acetyltransferase/amino-acid acetyltransferase ArgJ [Psychrobacter arenosus]